MNFALAIYDITVKTCFSCFKSARKLLSPHSTAKIDRFIRLQDEWKDRIKTLPPKNTGDKTIWIHCSSLGEFQIARPLLRRLKEIPGCRVVLSFFSPTGIIAMEEGRFNAEGADLVTPLPLDTKKNVTTFLDAVNPDVAVFMVAEFWPNFLEQLKKRGIKTVLYSALLPKKDLKGSIKSEFKKRMLRKFDRIVTHDPESLDNIRSLGGTNVEQLADPLFENALNISTMVWSDPVIESFIAATRNVLVAGSVHLDRDLEMVKELSDRFPDTKIILVPHETAPADIERVIAVMGKGTVAYSNNRQNQEVLKVSEAKCLVIDFVGVLAKIYRYGKGAYVGGGFTRLLHSVAEPLAYGIPVAFGPVIHRKYLPALMMKLGIGTMVSEGSQLCRWWEDVVSGKIDAEKVKEESFRLCRENIGGSEKGVSLILDMIDK